MSKEALTAFLAKAQKDPELQAEIAALAAKHGYEFSADELSEVDLDSVVGGVTFIAGEAKDRDHERWIDIVSARTDPEPLP